MCTVNNDVDIFANQIFIMCHQLIHFCEILRMRTQFVVNAYIFFIQKMAATSESKEESVSNRLNSADHLKLFQF